MKFQDNLEPAQPQQADPHDGRFDFSDFPCSSPHSRRWQGKKNHGGHQKKRNWLVLRWGRRGRADGEGDFRPGQWGRGDERGAETKKTGPNNWSGLGCEVNFQSLTGQPGAGSLRSEPPPRLPRCGLEWNLRPIRSGYNDSPRSDRWSG